MKWSGYVSRLHREGYTNQQIIETCNMPFINDDYIKKVLHKPVLEDEPKRPWTPTSLTHKKVQAYFETHPIEEIYTTSSVVLGKIIGVSDMVIRDYKKSNLRPRIKINKYLGKYRTYERRLILEGRMKQPEKQKTIQDIEKLW